MQFNVIHLPNRIDRWSLIQKEISDQKISDVRFWNGIIDNTLPCRGISRAHKQIVTWARDQDYEEVLIAEDDIRFTALGAFQYFLKNKPTDFDIYLGGITWGTVKNNQTVNDFSGM